MPAGFGARKHRRRPSINITPLIDVMFLLLIFLMVSTTFRDRVGIEVSLPLASTGAEQQIEPREITVRASGEIFFEGSLASPEELRGQLEAVLSEEPDAPLLLSADEEAAFQSVVTAIDIAREVGGAQLVIQTKTHGARPE